MPTWICNAHEHNLNRSNTLYSICEVCPANVDNLNSLFLFHLFTMWFTFCTILKNISLNQWQPASCWYETWHFWGSLYPEDHSQYLSRCLLSHDLHKTVSHKTIIHDSEVYRYLLKPPVYSTHCKHTANLKQAKWMCRISSKILGSVSYMYFWIGVMLKLERRFEVCSKKDRVSQKMNLLIFDATNLLTKKKHLLSATCSLLYIQ